MSKKAFTLIELAIVAVIVGILAAIAVPNLSSMVSRSYSQDAKNALMTIYAAQQNYAQSNDGLYCYPSSAAMACDGSVNCCSNLDNINSNLGLNIVASGSITYSCTATLCTVTKTGSGAFTMQALLTSPIVIKPSPVRCNVGGPDSTYNPCCTSGGASPGAVCP